MSQSNRANTYTTEFKDSAVPQDPVQEELKRLRKENTLLREERDTLKKSGGVLCVPIAVKYAFIQQHQNQFRVARMCRLLGVSRSGFYEWQGRPESAHCQEDRRLGEQIKTLFDASGETYGTRRLQKALDEQGQPVSRARIARLMRAQDLRIKT